MPAHAFQTLLKEGFRFVILNVPADVLLSIADGVQSSDVLLLNSAPDDRLRVRTAAATFFISLRAGRC